MTLKEHLQHNTGETVETSNAPESQAAACFKNAIAHASNLGGVSLKDQKASFTALKNFWASVHWMKHVHRLILLTDTDANTPDITILVVVNEPMQLPASGKIDLRIRERYNAELTLKQKSPIKVHARIIPEGAIGDRSDEDIVTSLYPGTAIYAGTVHKNKEREHEVADWIYACRQNLPAGLESNFDQVEERLQKFWDDVRAFNLVDRLIVGCYKSDPEQQLDPEYRVAVVVKKDPPSKKDMVTGKGTVREYGLLHNAADLLQSSDPFVHPFIVLKDTTKGRTKPKLLKTITSKEIVFLGESPKI